MVTVQQPDDTDPVQYIINEKGERTAAVIPIEQYEEMLEDLIDLRAIVKQMQEQEELVDLESITES